MGAHVVVVGSINVDLVVDADRLPHPGETVRGGVFEQHFGGKGANQAVAAARAGARVTMVGAVGEDPDGDASLAALVEEGIDVSRVRRVQAHTGVALIVVGPRGENQIVVAPGANAAFTAEDVRLDGLDPPDAVLTTLEVPVEVAIAALTAARRAKVPALLDPAPAHALSGDLLEIGPILTPNEHELIVAIGNDDPTAALDELARRNRGPVIVTQGPAGALLAEGETRRRFPGQPAAEVLDTTGAGDAFAGVLATWLAEGRSLEDAIVAANVAGALAVGRRGARAAMPLRAELDAAIGR